MKRTTLTGAAALALLLVAGCNRGGDQLQDDAANVAAEPATTVVEEEVPVEEVPVPVANTVAENVVNAVKAAPPPSISEQQQVLDDADATGMTAQINQAEADAAATGEQQ